MAFFRRKVSRDTLSARPATAEDGTRLMRLVHTAERRFLTSAISELADLFHADPTVLLESEGRLVGVASFGWRTPPVAWLRTLLLQNDVHVTTALQELGTPAYALLRAA